MLQKQFDIRVDQCYQDLLQKTEKKKGYQDAAANEENACI